MNKSHLVISVCLTIFFTGCATRLNQDLARRSVAALDSKLLKIPDELHIFSKDGTPQPVLIRKATLAEVRLLLKSDESDTPEENIRRYWKQTPQAYYRWDLTSDGEIGLITDIAKDIGQLASEGPDILPELLPSVVVTNVSGKDRIVGFGSTYGGDVKFHTDSAMRKAGNKGIGKVLIADYLRWCFMNKTEPKFYSVNGSYGFYEKMGFKYSDPSITPATVKDPAATHFPMFMPLSEVPAALENLKMLDVSSAAKAQ